MIDKTVRLFVSFMAIMLSFGLTIGSPQSAIASIHTYREIPGQVTYRSQQSLRARKSNQAWQAVLFKRLQANALEGIYLRLVGFPGMVEVDPSSPLRIETGTELQWQAQPAVDQATLALPANVGQYDAQSLISGLTGDIPLQLTIPLKAGRTADLLVPPFVVKEWRSLADMN